MKNMRVLKSAALLMMLTAQLSIAQDVDEPSQLDKKATYLGIRSSYQSCTDRSEGMPALIECARSEFSYQDKRLNTIYASLMKSIPKSDRDELRNEERAWIASKEQTCLLPQYPGQGQVLDSIACSVTETARRARYLEQKLKSKS